MSEMAWMNQSRELVFLEANYILGHPVWYLESVYRAEYAPVYGKQEFGRISTQCLENPPPWQYEHSLSDIGAHPRTSISVVSDSIYSVRSTVWCWREDVDTAKELLLKSMRKTLGRLGKNAQEWGQQLKAENKCTPTLDKTY